MDWHEVVSEVIQNPCAHCGDDDSYPSDMEHWGMPVTRPGYVDEYLEGLTGPNEQHTVDPEAHCINPKCGYHFTPEDEQQIRQNRGEFTCPQCGFTQNVFGHAPTYMSDDPDAWYDLQDSGQLPTTQMRPANPGGTTRSGLTLEQMGHIGEEVVLRMGELPGIGPIVKASEDYNFPIDAIVESQKGKFGCEIKTNHSQAQERFKVGGKEERLEKIKYCLANGLKPALIGVRLNFFTDKAYIFFREGLTDTWIGNQQMIHVATLDFADLNPFKSPDPQAQAIAVENASLPDQSDDEFAGVFGPTPVTAKKKVFVVPRDIHDLKVVDSKGKHTHNIRRCHHCGVLYQKPVEHGGRFECPTCGKDVDEEPRRVARVVLGGPNVDRLAEDMGWQAGGRTGNGHRRYVWTDPSGYVHDVVTGSGAHDQGAQHLDVMHTRQRMQRCMRNPENCGYHVRPRILQESRVDVPGAPVLRAGQEVEVDDHTFFITEVDGNIVLAYDMQTGEEAYLERQGDQLVRAAGSEWSS